MLNLYKKIQISSYGQPLDHYNLDEIVDRLIKSSDYFARLERVKEFNLNNRWKKSGISIVPMKYPALWKDGYYSVNMSVFNHDGSVSLSHGGIEIGQGIHTKLAQVCAYELGIPLEMVTVKTANNTFNANSQWTGGSVTTEIVARVSTEEKRNLKSE